MKKFTSNDGTFLISQVTTDLRRNIAFCFSWESAIDKLCADVITKYPDYFYVLNGNEVWIKPTADNVITMEILEDAFSMDTTDSIVLMDFDAKQVLRGKSGWVDTNSLKEI